MFAPWIWWELEEEEKHMQGSLTRELKRKTGKAWKVFIYDILKIYWQFYSPPPLLDSNMFSGLLQKYNKFMKSRGEWRGGRGVLFYQNQVMIWPEVQLYIFQN